MNSVPELLRGTGSGEGLEEVESLVGVPLFLCHIHGHLLDENPLLKLFLLLRLDAKPLTD